MLSGEVHLSQYTWGCFYDPQTVNTQYIIQWSLIAQTVRAKIEFWAQETALTSQETSNLPEPPLKADH